MPRQLKGLSRSPSGFTLIELMITVAIIAILATIAYPSYTQYVIRANRSEAQQVMLDLANREEESLLNTRCYYEDTTGQTVGRYKITISASPADCSGSQEVRSYTITATPQSSPQTQDGPLTLDSNGTKTPLEKW